MRLEIRNAPYLFSGLLFAGVGVLALLGARAYAMGTATRMGPGYFPDVLSLLLIGLGAANVVRGVCGPERAQAERLWLVPLAAITIGLVGFGLLIEPLGLLPATGWLVLFACLGGRRFRPLETLLIYIVVALLATVVFVVWLRLPALHLVGAALFHN